MKKSLLVHGAWGLVAVGSFVVGTQFFQRESEGRDGRMGGPGRSGESGTLGMGDTAEARAGSRRGRRETNEESRSKPVLKGRDIETLGEAFRKGGTPIERRLAFARLLEGLTPENAKLVREQIEHLPADSAEFREFHYAWGAVAGVDAVMNGADTPKEDMAASLAGWAGADSAAAMAWFEGLDMENDPAYASLLGERGLSVEGLTKHLMVGMVYGMSDTDPDAATQFVLESVPEGQGDWMMGIVASKVIRAEDLDGAAAWAGNLPSGSMKAEAVRKIAENYASSDPQATVGWLESIPSGGDTSKAMQTAFSTWAKKDSEASGDYLNQMAASPQRDWAINGYAGNLAYKDPSAAIEWANSVGDPALREQTLIRTGQVYFHRGDREAAKAWLPNSGLSAEAQQQVVNPRGRR